ncbi:MAG: glucose 1-dehydrogenase [Gammaproteobacteria bacterium]|jgi:meso-butanediol dehydrogenase / (S,S)-butanediol dehydrogenase / diacetyl reductase|nr:glucose 1-dehydrogenase [Gammaproteobacteria bacterium]MBT7370154.1 glucose 1-dehydrogenase [Gammaproteobacteria bacterium]
MTRGLRGGRLSGKTALITGASRGIGRCIAEAFAGEGADLILTATSLEGLTEVAENVQALGAKCDLIAADLGDESETDRLFQKAVKASGEVEILVNNAGIYQGKPFEQYTMVELDRLMKVNVYAVFRLTQLAVVHMKTLGRGKIINIGSTAGKWESANQAAYNTTKHAVVGMSKCVALETAAYGINVNTICPGMVETDMFQDFEVHADAAGVSLDQLKEQVHARIPLGRFLQPGEIAPLAVYLGSAESDGMTGQTLTISGGMRMG